MAKTPKRTLLQRLFRCGLGRPLISLWVTDHGTFGGGQRHTETSLKLGRYTVLHWERYITPSFDMDESHDK